MELSDSPKGRRIFRDHLNIRAQQIVKGETDPVLEKEWKSMPRGWYLGSNDFGQRLLKAIETIVGDAWLAEKLRMGHRSNISRAVPSID